jgi:ribosome-binding protein aMBF1 (putative translation factor)
MTGSTLDTLHKKWLKRPGYRQVYKALETEFDMVAALIEARSHARLTQEQLAHRIQTTQTVIARLESGRVKPSTRTLDRVSILKEPLP